MTILSSLLFNRKKELASPIKGLNKNRINGKNSLIVFADFLAGYERVI
jgi:hypothetical protein